MKTKIQRFDRVLDKLEYAASYAETRFEIFDSFPDELKQELQCEEGLPLEPISEHDAVGWVRKARQVFGWIVLLSESRDAGISESRFVVKCINWTILLLTGSRYVL